MVVANPQCGTSTALTEMSNLAFVYMANCKYIANSKYITKKDISELSFMKIEVNTELSLDWQRVSYLATCGYIGTCVLVPIRIWIGGASLLSPC